MKKNQKKDNNPHKEVEAAYEKPAIEVIEMDVEGILCASTDPWGPGDTFP